MSASDKPDRVTPAAPNTWDALGNLDSSDVESLAFLVLMQAAKSAQEDLRAIMAQVKTVNQHKQKLRDLLTAASMKALSSGRQELLDERQLRTLITYLMKPC